MAGLMRGKSVFFFKDSEFQIWPALRYFQRSCQANNSAANDSDVELGSHVVWGLGARASRPH
jgi:hypothetical protein